MDNNACNPYPDDATLFIMPLKSLNEPKSLRHLKATHKSYLLDYKSKA